MLNIKKRNRHTTKEFRNGAKLRAWERKNRIEDFNLKWKEKEELHNIQTEQSYLMTLIMQRGQEIKPQLKEINQKRTELAKKLQLTQIEYNKIKQKRNIHRRGERKKILEQ